MKKLVLLCFLAFWGGISSLFAGQFVGVEMSYQYLGGCDYRLYYTMYIDCQGAATSLPANMTNSPIPYYFTFTGIGCTLPTINPVWVIYDAADITPICPASLTNSACFNSNVGTNTGVAAYRYYTDISFCGITCTSVDISWSSCCRGYYITSGLSGQGIATSLTIPLTFNNSSPRFVTPPVIYNVAGQTSTYQQAAFDEDGDSLVYSFASCFQNPGQMVTYNPGYSPTSPLGAGWSCSIDAQTGELIVAPSTGGLTSGGLGIQVDEYRNGILLGSINRDAAIYVVNVTNPGANTTPTASVTNVTGVGFQNPPYYLRTEAGKLLTFDIQVNDPDPGQLLAFNSNLAMLFPTATLTTSGNTSPMTLTFSWTPDASFQGKNLPLIIDVFDDFCTLNGHYYAFSNIGVDSNYIAANITPSDCVTPTGAIDVSVGGGFTPYTYTWSNGATTQDLVNVLGGTYSLTVTDASGTIWDSTFYVNSLGVSASTTAYPPDCNITNGALSIAALGGVLPYTYTWSNGQTGDSISNLPIGGYSVDVYDATGCVFHTATMLNYDPADSCFSRIEGTLFYDFNANCVQDPLEVGLANIYIDINPGGAVFTDANGHYSFVVNDIGTYQVSPTFSNSALASNTCLLPNLTLTPAIATLGVDSLANNFPMLYQSDIKVHHVEWVYVAGFNHTTTINCQNMSYYTANATLTYQYDAIMHNPVSSIPPTTLDTINHIITWNLSNFIPSSIVNISVISTTDAGAMIGDTVKTYTSIVPIMGDADPVNNQDTCIKTVVVSYDPNIKEVSPAGQTQYGLIPANTQHLEYTIHFQNTGNWPATFVIIKDTIDVAHLDITSTEIQMTSHNCVTSVENDSVLVFTFNNINLPDSFTNEPASHGFVKYGIKLQENLPLYTEMRNKAAIYFDFNAPIITNTTTNTLYNAMNLAFTGNTNICPGDSVLAVVTQGRSPYQFDWSNGVQASNNTSGISHIPANFTSGSQSVQVSDYYGAVVSHDFLLNVQPLADATFAYNPAGSNYFFTANSFNNASYLWDFGNGQTSTNPAATATYTQNGAYTVTLIVTDLCGGADTSTQTITLSVGLSPSLFQQQVNISPNPTADIVLLSFQNEAREPYTLTISDVNGKVIKSILNIKEEKITIHTNDMASGTYFWELKGKEMARGVLLVE